MGFVMSNSNATKVADIKSFHYLENGDIDFSIMPTIKSSPILDPGHYTVSYKPYPHEKIFMSCRKPSEPIKLTNFKNKSILDTLFSSFFNLEVKEQIVKLGFFHKVGVLLHGREGTGKSSMIKYYTDQLIKNVEAVVIHIDSPANLEEVWTFVQKIRTTQDNPMVIVLDEFDRIINPRSGADSEGFIKQILDGSMAIDNCIVLASTNYIDNIPDTIKNRPSRFKYILEIGGVEDLNDVNDIVTNMLGTKFTKEEIEGFCNVLKGKTLDEIKQDCLDRIMDLTVNKVAKKAIGFKIGETIITD